MHEHPDYREPQAQTVNNPPQEGSIQNGSIQKEDSQKGSIDSECFQKFLSLDEEKRGRVLNAAMKEFMAGYKKASTDAIVREAGISKGLLFHYFGTKEKLYTFLVDYAIDTVKKEFLDLINVTQPDILDSVWQMSLLKRDLAFQYPDMFDFIATAYVHEKNKGGNISESLARFMKTREAIINDIYDRSDKSLFRDDIDSQMAVNIINWALYGYSHAKMTEVDTDNIGVRARENYDIYLDEFQKILGILRLCFYKNPEG